MKNNNNKRKPPKKFTFSDDFVITYTAYPKEPNKKSKNNTEVKYNLRMPISQEQKKRNVKAYGRMASKSRLSVKVSDNDLKKLKNILFNKIWGNDKIRKNVIEEV